MLRHAFHLFILFSSLTGYVANANEANGYNTDLRMKMNEIAKGIAPDPDRKKIQFVAYTSVIEYGQDTSMFSDEQIAGLAVQGDHAIPRHFKTQSMLTLLSTCRDDRPAHSLVGELLKLEIQDSSLVREAQDDDRHHSREIRVSRKVRGQRSHGPMNHVLKDSSSTKMNQPNILIKHKDDTLRDNQLTRILQQCLMAEYGDQESSNSKEPHGNQANCAESKWYFEIT